MLYLGATHRLNRNFNNFDWRFYIDTYPDLKENGITDPKSANRHWRQYGMTGGRIGARHMYNPDGHVGGSFALAINRNFYEVLLKNIDNKKVLSELQRKYSKDIYVSRPNLIVKRVDETVMKQNQWVPSLYDKSK